MKNPIYDLKCIALHLGPEATTLINNWIRDNIQETHIEINESHPRDKEHRDYAIRAAQSKLGTKLAENANMYPTFVKDGPSIVCRMSVLYFKNEFGK